MLLRFIGADGSRGLRRGQVYNVGLHSDVYFIWAHVRVSWINEIRCPYETPQAFAKNWEASYDNRRIY